MMIVQPARFGVACAIDPYAANRSFFLRGRGANGAKPTTDELGNPLTWGGGAQISTAVALWPSYGSSLAFNGTNAYIGVPDSLFGFGIGGGPFSFGARFRTSVTPSPYAFIMNHSAGNGGWGPGGEQCILYLNSSGALVWQFWSGGSIASIFGSTNLCDGATHEALVTYDGTTTRLFADGALIGTTTGAYTDVADTSTRIGSAVSGSNWFNGYMVDVTVWNAAVHTAAYTPPTLPPC